VWNDASEWAHQLFLSLCHQNVEQKIVSSDQWDSVNKWQNVIGLLTMIWDAALPHDEIKGGTMQVVEQDIRLYVYGFQKQHQSLMDYYKLFKAQVEVINVYDSCFGYHPGLTKRNWER
jgi:hypothetical protein